MYNITLNASEVVGAIDGSIFNTLSPTQSDLDALRDEMKALQEIMSERFNAIEDQIFFVRRDQVLEEDYNELKEAWEAYNDLMEKLRTFKRLKDSA